MPKIKVLIVDDSVVVLRFLAELADQILPLNQIAGEIIRTVLASRKSKFRRQEVQEIA